MENLAKGFAEQIQLHRPRERGIKERGVEEHRIDGLTIIEKNMENVQYSFRY